MNTQGYKFDLTLFDGEGGAAAAGEGANGENAGVSKEAAAPLTPRRQKRENPLANVRYGKQEASQGVPQGVAAPTKQEAPAEPTEEEWNTAKEKYREFFNRDTTSIVQERLRNSKQAEASLDKLKPILEGMGRKYGKEPGDIDGILAAYTDDDSLYEEEAAAAGMPVSVYKQLQQMKAEKEQRDLRDQQSMQEQRFQQHIQGMVTAFEKDVKSVFPNADLRTELQNPHFQRLTSPEVGVSVKDAYWLIHRAEIEPMAMQFAAQKAQEKLSQAVQSGANRPVENGARAFSPALDIRDDPTKWTPADRREVRKIAMQGGKITL